MGCGGFINITQNAKKVVYCGTFTAGGLKIAVENGKLIIKQEGKGKKYVKKVEQVTFSGAYATETKQPVLFVTERAVFELTDGVVTLTEDCPGVPAGRGHPRPDGASRRAFLPTSSPCLPEIFQSKWGGLRKILEARKYRPASPLPSWLPRKPDTDRPGIRGKVNTT